MPISKTTLKNKNPEELAYEMIFNQYRHLLLKKAKKYLEDIYEAEDVVSIVLYRVWKDKLWQKEMQSLQSYLVTSVTNECIKKYRKRIKEELTIKHYTTRQDSYALPDDRLDIKKLQQIMDNAIRNLPAKGAAIFRQVYLEGKKEADVAKEMEISVNTVYVHIHACLKKLRSAYLSTVTELNEQ